MKVYMLLQSLLRYGVVLFLLPSCLGYKELPVEYDYSYKGQFKRYGTFDLLTEKGTNPTQSDEVIEKSIISRMKFLGYNRTHRKPQLLVGYKVFQDSLRYRGYVQPEMELFLKDKVNKEMEYQRMNFTMESGTLAIYFFDTRQHRAIWQGYAVGLSKSLDYNNTRHLRNAVISILDQYRVWADGFLERAQQGGDIDN